MVGVELSVITKGRIPGGVKREVANVLRDCYRRFGFAVPNMVEVQIVDRENTMRDFLKEEKFRLGITATGEEEFACSHDVWRGYPRIIICYDRLARLNKLAREGAVRHQAAHSVLHGSLEYSIFSVPDDCRRVAMIKGLDTAVLGQVLHYLSVAVKDCEATRFLVKNDYINCQVAFALELFQPSEEDKSTWKTVKTNRQAKFVYQIALLKPILFTHPLLALPKSKKISLNEQILLGRRVEELVEYMEEAERNRLLQVANVIAEALTDDTHKNVDFAFIQVMNLA